MKKIYLITLGLLALMQIKAQETVIWGTQVIDVSSEYSPYEYSAIQALYRPNVLPSEGENPNAWRPKSTSKEEFIMVSFTNPIQAKQIAIAESENPGAVKAVYGYDTEYNEYLLFELTPRDLPIKSRLLNLFFDLTTYKLEAVRVVLDCSVSEGYNAIDAIGVSASNIPINVLLDLANGVNTEIDATRLSENVNSDYTEHSPIVSPDGKRLYFSRQFHPENIGGVDDAEDIWYSELDEETGEWLPAKNVGPPLNNEGPNFISSISLVNGKEVLILGNRYGKKGRMYSGVSRSERVGESFAKPESIEIENEYNYSPNADFFLTSSGETMILSAERDDTYGLRDLYVCFKQADGTWSEPANMGLEINSVGEDESPFMAADGKTLYFSSDGYSGYGGADIYVSFRLDNSWKKWSTPENLGPGINREGNDEYFSIPATGQNLYFTRGAEGEDTDVFSFKASDLFTDESSPLYSSIGHLLDPEETPTDEDIMVTVTGRIVDSKTNEPVAGAEVLIERLPDGLDIGRASTSEDGSFKFTVPAGSRYGLAGEATDYISEDQNLDFQNINEADTTVTQNLVIHPIEKGEKVVLNNIFFDFNKSTLRTSSYPVLNRILDYLKKGTIQQIKITGHTDSVGDANYNMGLSGRRAKSVMDYFLNNGISKDRLTYKAFGETQPAVDNTTVENRRKNRRVEFIIEE